DSRPCQQPLPPRRSSDLTVGSIGHAGERPGRDAPSAQSPPPRGAEQPEVPGHVLYFQRLVMFGERAAATRPATGAGAGPRDGAEIGRASWRERGKVGAAA